MRVTVRTVGDFSGKTLQQLIALVPTLASRRTSVRFINDDQFWTGAQKLGTPSLALDVVEADNCVRMRGENTLAWRKVAFEACSAGCRYSDGTQVEAAFELANPLLDKVWRTKYGKSLNVAAIKQLACDKRGLYRLADTNIVGDQQANGVEFERHEQWHELVGARLDRDLPKAAKRTGTPAQREHKRVAQKQCSIVPPHLRQRRLRKRCIYDRHCFKCEVDICLVLFGTRDRANA